MSYSRWSNSVWYVYGSQYGLEIHHTCGRSAHCDDAMFEEAEPPFEAVRLQFPDCSEKELKELDTYVRMYWEDTPGEGRE